MVADRPEGPFKDAIGKPLLKGFGYIDPSVFIDDDGRAYLYWGNPKLLYVKLNEDMISYSGEVNEVPLTTESFGVRSKDDRTTRYEEGPWLYKRNDLYYMIFAAGPIPEHIAYTTGPTATGPWTFGDTLMPTQRAALQTIRVCVITRAIPIFLSQRCIAGWGRFPSFGLRRAASF